MIEAIIKSSGSIINKPVIHRVIIEDETAIAVKRKDEETNKVEQLTIAQLFDSFLRKSSYTINGIEVDSKLFTEWFNQKHLNKSLQSRLISIDFRRI